MTDDPTGRLALALDDLLRRLDPTTVAVLRAGLPVALRDQLDAAAAQVRAGALAAAQRPDVVAVHDRTPDDTPDWIRLGALTALAGWLTGRASTCLHNPHPARPQPVVAAAWRPGLITCGHCTHLLELPAGTAADRTCDRCGRITTGPDRQDGIHPALIVVGALSYLFGTCADCRADTEDPHEPLAKRSRTGAQ